MRRAVVVFSKKNGHSIEIQNLVTTDGLSQSDNPLGNASEVSLRCPAEVESMAYLKGIN